MQGKGCAAVDLLASLPNTRTGHAAYYDFNPALYVLLMAAVGLTNMTALHTHCEHITQGGQLRQPAHVVAWQTPASPLSCTF
jgi:hypothetical protein